MRVIYRQNEFFIGKFLQERLEDDCTDAMKSGGGSLNRKSEGTRFMQ